MVEMRFLHGAKNCPWHRVIAYMDVSTWNLSRTKFLTTHMDVGNADFAWSRKSAVHPEHIRSLPSMAPRHTVRPERKKPGNA